MDILCVCVCVCVRWREECGRYIGRREGGRGKYNHNVSISRGVAREKRLVGH